LHFRVVPQPVECTETADRSGSGEDSARDRAGEEFQRQ
jgi:hypothetical protein